MAWLSFRRKAHTAAQDMPAPFDLSGAVLLASNTQPQWPEDSYENYAREGYGRNELICACIREIATSAAEARLRAVQDVGDGEQQEAPDSPLGRLLRRPNPRQTQYEFIELLHTHLQVAGNAYIYMQPDRANRVTALYLLRPDRMKVIPGDYGVPLGFVYEVEGKKYPLDAANIGQIKLPNPFDDWYGLSPMHTLTKVGNLDQSITDFQKVFFQNAGVPLGVLNLKRKLTSEEQAQKIRANWKSQFAGLPNYHRLAILDEDATYQQIAANFDSLALPNLRNISESRICAIFGVPPIVVGALVGLEHATYANYEQARLSLWEETLSPLYRRITDALNLWLAPRFGDTITADADFSEVTALQDDQGAKSVWLTALYDKGILSKNDVRVELGYDSVDGGDVFRIPINVIEYQVGTKPVVLFDNGKPKNPALFPPDAPPPGDPATEGSDDAAAATDSPAPALGGTGQEDTAKALAAHVARTLSRIDGVLGRSPYADAAALLPPKADLELAEALAPSHGDLALSHARAINADLRARLDTTLAAARARAAERPAIAAELRTLAGEHLSRLAAGATQTWHTQDDNEVCAECEALDGKTVPVGQPFAYRVDAPPLHDDCRCTVTTTPAGSKE